MTPARVSDLVLPAKTVTLANGLRLVTHVDRTAPVVAVALTYRVGSQHELLGQFGAAHLLEHLMAHGTRSLAPGEIARRIEGGGGICNAHTARSHTSFYAVVSTSALEQVLWAEAERMDSLEIDARALALEQQVVLEEVRWRYTNVPYARALDAGLAEAAFTRWENRHGTIGEPADIRGVGVDDMRRFYRAYYAPNNAAIALIGDLDEQTGRALVERAFGSVRPRELAPALDLSEPPFTNGTRTVIEDRFAQIPMLVIGWRAPERGTRDYWALTLLALLLDAADESPVHQALVKDARVACSLRCTFPWWVGHFSPGGPELFGLHMLLKPGTTPDEALAQVDRVMARLAGEMTAQRVASTKAQAELFWHRGLMQHLGRARILSAYAATIGDPAGLHDDGTALMSLTVEDVRRAAQEWLANRHGCIVEIRPAPDAPLPADLPMPPIPEAQPRTRVDGWPRLREQRPIAVPAIVRFALSNGLDVMFVRDRRLPLLDARLIMRGGSVAERRGEEGLSEAATALLLSGAGDRDATRLASDLARIGWMLSVVHELEHVTLVATGLSRTHDEFFRTLGTVLREATYPEPELALWRENTIAGMKNQRTAPEFMAWQRLIAELFDGHPYGRPAPTDDQIAAISRDRVQHWQRQWLGPREAVLVLVGDAEAAALRDTLEAGLAAWTGAARAPELPPIPDRAPPPLAIVDRPGTRQVSLTIAQVVDLDPRDPDYLAFQVANQVLGGSTTSRLFTNLRIEQGYTYGTFSRVQPVGDRLIWRAWADVRPEVVAAALTEMRREIARLREEELPGDTLDDATRYLAGRFLLGNASPDVLADSLATCARQRLSAEQELATYLPRLRALTPAIVQRVVRRCCDPRKMLTIAVGDAPTLRRALAP